MLFQNGTAEKLCDRLFHSDIQKTVYEISLNISKRIFLVHCEITSQKLSSYTLIYKKFS